MKKGHACKINKLKSPDRVARAKKTRGFARCPARIAIYNGYYLPYPRERGLPDPGKPCKWTGEQADKRAVISLEVGVGTNPGRTHRIEHTGNSR